MHKLLIRLKVVLMISLTVPVAQAYAQTSSRSTGATTKDENQTGFGGRANIVVVPLFPTLFNVDPDLGRAMKNESGLSYDQQRDLFNRALTDQLRRDFGSTVKITSLLDDTVKMKADLKQVFANTGTEWSLTTAPLNPVATTTTATKTTPATNTTGIKNGQVQTVGVEGDRFMNATLLNNKALELLKAKYKADYVIFINQIDLKNDLGSDPYNLGNAEVYRRSAIVHFTVFSTTTNKRTAAGKVTATFGSTDNIPRVIIQKIMPVLSKQIVQRYTAGLKPVSPTTGAAADSSKGKK